MKLWKESDFRPPSILQQEQYYIRVKLPEENAERIWNMHLATLDCAAPIALQGRRTKFGEVLFCGMDSTN